MRSKQSKSGKLIILEGPDGVGKSSFAKETGNFLHKIGQPCEVMSFPGREPSTLGKLVYEIHHDAEKFNLDKITAVGLQALHISAHLDAIDRLILPTLKAGRHVVLDRFWWSTWVYGVTSGINQDVLEAMIKLERAQWGPIQPAVAILLRREKPIDRDENLASWKQLRKHYDSIANQEKTRYPVVTYENSDSFEAGITYITLLIKDNLFGDLKKTGERKNLRKETPKGEQLALNLIPSKITEDKIENIYTYSHLLPARPTIAYDTYWRFAAERQEVFFRKLRGEPEPWTNDQIISRFKFTNAYRASDRTSQYLIKNVIYRDDLPQSHDEIFFRILLFKVFNKIETWKLLEERLGEITYDNYSFDQYDQILTQASSAGKSIYSAAYIMPSGGRVLGHSRKHRNHLELIQKMIADDLPKKLSDASNMHVGFDLLRSYPTIGDFLAYQFITDINYSELTNFSEMSFVIPGPGALDGIRKCFEDLGGLNEPEIIKFMADNQQSEFERLGLDFKSLFGRPLQLIDCQNLFCEVDKYSRVRHPEISGISGRTRIKQKYVVDNTSISYWYPPKWGINDAVRAYVRKISFDREN